MITGAETLNLVDYPSYPPELELHECKDNEEDIFYDAPTVSSLPAGYRPYSQLDYFRQLIANTMVMIQMRLNMLKR